MKPSYLETGDSVYLLSISRAINFDISNIQNTLESWGLKVIVGTTAISGGYCQFSGTENERLLDFQKALDDKKIKAIFFCKGGYGAVQIIDKVDLSEFVKSPKWLVGFSDITLIHSHIHSSFSIETIHGAMPVTFATSSEKDITTLRQCLFGQTTNFEIDELENHKIKTVTGHIIGGNLSILHTLKGTPSDIETDKKILLIEDTNENLMSIERMLYALKRTGKFDKLKALLVGDFKIPIADNETSNSIVKEYPAPTKDNVESALKILILNLLSEYDFPICFGLPIGHKAGRNIAVYFGRQTTISMTSNKLTFDYE